MGFYGWMDEWLDGWMIMSCQTALASISARWRIAALSPSGGFPSGGIEQLAREATATAGFEEKARNRGRARKTEICGKQGADGVSFR